MRLLIILIILVAPLGLSSQVMKWDTARVSFSQASKIVQLGYAKADTIYKGYGFRLDTNSFIWPRLSEFPVKLETECQDKTWLCWCYASNNLASKYVGFNVSEDALGYWNMRFNLERLVKANEIDDIQGGSMDGWKMVIDSIGVWPEGVFVAKTRSQLGETVPLVHKIHDLMRKDTVGGGKITQKTLQEGYRLIDTEYGIPPMSFKFRGKTYTPKQLRDDYKLTGKTFTCVASRMRYPYWQNLGYDASVKSNWQTSGWNLPAELLIPLMEFAIQKGSGFIFEGDANEAYFVKDGTNLTVVPSWYCDWENMSDQDKRMRREIGFVDETTTPNHAYHCFSSVRKGGKLWILARDSAPGAWKKKSMEGLWIHDANHLALKSYCLQLETKILKDFISQLWVLKKYPEAKKILEGLE